MARADTTVDSNLLYFLFKQLIQSWHTDILTLVAQGTLSEILVLQKTAETHIPPLISFLASLADTSATEHVPAAKELPCGHKVAVHSILTCSNLFGDQLRSRGPRYIQCPQCATQQALPMIPDPWVVDGLRARLDLVEWAWGRSKHAPTRGDKNVARLLRYILDQIGHLPRDSETTSSLPSKRRQRQTLRLLETEAMVLAEGKIYEDPCWLRGTEPYCRFRPSTPPPPEYVHLRYSSPSPGQHCKCEAPHTWTRSPKEWTSTPAEDEEEWDFAISRIENSGKTRKPRKKKMVRFAAPVITEIHYFEPWWRSEYCYSTRYYSLGPSRRSVDLSTKLDDDREIARLNDRIVTAETSNTRRRHGDNGRRPWKV